MRKNSRKHMALHGTLGLVVLVGYACGGVTLKEQKTGGKTAYRLENERVVLLLSSARGGAVTSYKDKRGGHVELIHQQPRNGLCMDHFQAQPWPGELLDAAYSGKAVKQSVDECTVRFTYDVKGHWRGAEYPKLNGLLLQKTYTLRAGSPALGCEVRITAPKTEARLFAYWLQNVFFAGGRYDMDADVCFRPSVRGVRRKAGKDFGHYGREGFLRDFSGGWMALVDTQAKTGLAVLSNYDDLDVLYACAGNRTVEPMYRMTYLPAGASVAYTTHIVPLAGLDNVAAASEDFVAGYRMKSDGKGNGWVALSVVRSVTAPKRLTLDVSVMSVDSPDKTVKAGQIVVENLSEKPQTKKLTFAGAGGDPLVLKVQATVALAAGKTRTHHLEDYYNGSYKWGENIKTDMATPYYAAPRPPQKIRLQKPKAMRLANPGQYHVWYAEGLLDDMYNVTSAVRLTSLFHEGRTLRHRAFVRRQGSFGTRLSSFPFDYEKLLAYNAVVLGGVKRDALGDVGIEMLCDFLDARGGMIVLGGPLAYGFSGLAGSKLGKRWPVTPASEPFDMQDLGSAPIQVAENVPFLVGLDWSAKPCVKYLHQVAVKPWGKTVLTAGGQPFLVIGEAGKAKARVACILGAPMGTLGKGKTPFWEWEDWRFFLRQVYWWVVRHDDMFRK